jgi:energy-converting hydrogenase Eha subunit C
MSAACASGARAPRSKSTGADLPSHILQMYVSSVSDVSGMLQVFRIDVAKVDRDVAYVASVSEACRNRLFIMLYLFQTYVASVFYLDVAHVSHLCCKSIFKMFQLFHYYVALYL